MPVKGSISVNELYCKGCELCMAACPKNVISMADRLTPKGYHPAELTGEGCTGCEICAIVCPDAAITVYREDAASKRKQPASVRALSVVPETTRAITAVPA